MSIGLLLAGCSGPVQFEPDAVAVVARGVAPGHADQVQAVVTELFGTPDEPRLPALPEGLAELIDLEQVRQAAGPVASHEVGVTTGLYRRHCARCHGITGDGRGPTALYQHPYPRDFRRGVFKFTSTPRGVPPTDADLHATLMRGVPGTAMPSFQLLKPEERSALVEYVKYLAVRGQLEQELIDFAGDELEYDPLTGVEGRGISLSSEADKALVLGDMLNGVVDRWRQAPDQVIDPPAPPAGFPDQLVDRGRELFGDGQRLGCVGCHDQEQRSAPASPAEEYDIWNLRRHEFREQTAAHANELSRVLNKRENAGRGGGFAEGEIAARLREMDARQRVVDTMLPPVAARPRRLGEQPLRGGGEPVDLFRRIQQGVGGAPMPASASVLSDEEVWSLVAYVLAAGREEPTPDEAVRPETPEPSADTERPESAEQPAGTGQPEGAEG